MQSEFYFFIVPFLTCLVLSGIHCYLGFHVLAREVIFVDLSLAQIAALGSTLSLLFQIEHDAQWTYFISLFATLLASLVFALARKYSKKISQEAIIGITYAFGSAAVVIVVDKMAHGAEHIKSLMVGQLLWVSRADLLKTFLIYTAVGAVHFVFRKNFIAASTGELKKNRAFWDFLFYALFGVIITSSVQLAGVLQVFAYLIVPASVANIFFKSFKNKLLFGWFLGAFVSFLGLMLSYYADVPTGACLVVLFTSIPLVLLFIFPFLKLDSKTTRYSLFFS